MSDAKLQLTEPGIWTKTSWIQIGYGIWVNQVLVTVGLAFGFSAVALPQLDSPYSKIHSTIRNNAWIAGALTLMQPIGCLICGFMMDRFGRRMMMILCMIPMTFGWLYTGFASTAHDIILGRIVTGIGCGMASAPPRAYGTEICLPSMRGVIGVLPSLAMAAGILIQASLGTWLEWDKLCYICGCYSLLLMVLNWMLPETPYYVLMHGTIDKAKACLKRFRAKDYRTDYEVAEMKEFKSVNGIRFQIVCKPLHWQCIARCNQILFRYPSVNCYIQITEKNSSSGFW
ncbi:solute carrier family 2, facilitated glucose transporter member 8-like [Pectinophora gossypiella]|uniref:solute carrier family 2, facilitated glucose transporter member 8-like n=1 Tax=Pectinophora gossypiella TaxID=13191 RepID=UPI00214E4F80|nr:solute carrier family 2, facilitated glucose transporter member 8-like [Pectinophora gossypiella]